MYVVFLWWPSVLNLVNRWLDSPHAVNLRNPWPAWDQYFRNADCRRRGQLHKHLKCKNPCNRIGSCHDRLCIFCRRCISMISPSYGGLLNSTGGGAKSQAGSQAPNPVIGHDIHSIFSMHVPASPIVYDLSPAGEKQVKYRPVV